eukprot:364836-Chlamydomonas_euryale.AAC.6
MEITDLEVRVDAGQAAYLPSFLPTPYPLSPHAVAKERPMYICPPLFYLLPPFPSPPPGCSWLQVWRPSAPPCPCRRGVGFHPAGGRADAPAPASRLRRSTTSPCAQ